MKNTRMFSMITRTWNPVTGCLHNCVYCWARRYAERLKKFSDKYKWGFTPAIHKGAFKAKFRENEFVFVTDMGDLFGRWVPDQWIKRVIKHIEKFPKTQFLFLTKNPKRYFEFDFPENVWLGATIETDLDNLYIERRISMAPPPSRRLSAMKRLQWDKKFISVEPIITFSERFADHLIEVNPKIVYVGYDNWGSGLPEPDVNKTLELIRTLRQKGICVFIKTIPRR